MEVEAAVETPLIFAGDRIRLSVKFSPPANNSDAGSPPVLLSGYAVVQGSFKLGDMLLSEPFADTRKHGIVLTKRGIEYGQPQSNSGLFAGMLDGLKHLVVTGPSEGRGSSMGAGGAGATGSNSGSSGTGSSSGASRGVTGYGGGDYDEGDYPIFATSQLLLFTDLKLTKPETFYFSVDLPQELPPTYRSRSLQIVYNLVVGFERIRLGIDSRPIDPKPVDTRLFLPFRLFAKSPTASNPYPPKFDLRNPINAPSPHLLVNHNDDAPAVLQRDSPSEADISISESESGDSSSTSKSTSDNMLLFIDDLLDGKSGSDKRNRGSSVANYPGAQYTKVCYDISKNKTSIAQLVLAKPATFVGDVLAAQIRFNRPCLHISVFLELEEQIEEPYAALAHTPLGSNGSISNTHTSPTTSNHASNAGANSEPEVATSYTIYARQFQGVYGLKELPIYLPTLTSITPRLDTEQVTASWSLRLEFVGLTGSAFALEEENNGLLAKGQVDHETFTCRIPVVILPPFMGGHSVAKTWKF